MKIDLSKIRLDGGTQPRAALNEEWTLEIVESLNAGATLPPVTVFHDGKDYWLADGFHRVKAHVFRGAKDIEADVKQGTLADAQWFSYSANKSHGQRRSNDDKQRAVRAALLHANGAKLTDRQISEHVGVDHKTIGSARSKLVSVGEIPQHETRIGRDGKSYNPTANIGKPKPAPNIQPIRQPEPPDEWKCSTCGLMWGFDVAECLDCNPPEPKERPRLTPSIDECIKDARKEVDNDPSIRVQKYALELLRLNNSINDFDCQRAIPAMDKRNLSSFYESLEITRQRCVALQASIDSVLEKSE